MTDLTIPDVSVLSAVDTSCRTTANAWAPTTDVQTYLFSQDPDAVRSALDRLLGEGWLEVSQFPYPTEWRLSVAGLERLKGTGFLRARDALL